MGTYRKRVIIPLVLILLAVTGCSNRNYTMDESTEIKVEHTNKTELGRIEVKDSYTLKGEKYYVLNISLSNKPITVSEREYEKYFGGLENDAFETEVYTMNLEMEVVEYKNSIFWSSPLKNADTSYDYREDSKYIYNESCVKVRMDDNGSGYDRAFASINNTRFSIFGENDFTGEEIEANKDNLKLIGNDFIGSLN
ncbi:hypothetical protein [Lacrimispora amygdalina]|uniref:hypothetical protein n=1 Tax=Lacrimispora amygdalina TaxID=253257 RepID=UPI000BE449BC|nr:hypothetical protein [Lacrimispora amygdalina]